MALIDQLSMLWRFKATAVNVGLVPVPTTVLIELIILDRLHVKPAVETTLNYYEKNLFGRKRMLKMKWQLRFNGVNLIIVPIIDFSVRLMDRYREKG